MSSSSAPRAVCESEPVSRAVVRVGGNLVDPPTSSGRQDDRPAPEEHEPPRGDPDTEGSGYPPVRRVLEDPRDLDLVDEWYVPVQDLVLEGPDQLETGAVPDVAEPAVGVSPERALHDLPVLGPVEEGSVLLELMYPLDHLLRVDLGHPPVAQVLSLHDCVGEVNLPAVCRVDVPERGRYAALRHDGMRLSHQDLGDDQRVSALVERFYRCPKPRAARADNKHAARDSLIRDIVDRDLLSRRNLGPQLRRVQPLKKRAGWTL